jgi:hypothetical protein
MGNHMRLFFITVVSMTLFGCATTNYPQLPATLVSRTDELARQYIKALATRDRQQLIALGRTPAEADDDIANAPHLAMPANPRYLLDMVVADSYARQYAVAITAGGEVEIRCWFSESNGSAVIKGYQVLPRSM